MNLLRFYLSNHSNERSDYLSAISKAFELSKRDCELRELIILGKTNVSLKAIRDIFGKSFSKMRKGYQFPDSSLLFKTSTMRSFKKNNIQNAIVLACNLKSDDIFYIEEFSSVKAVIAIATPACSPERWIKIWRPMTDLRRNEIIEPYEDPSCITKMAMTCLSELVDAHNELNSFSRKLVKTYLLVLSHFEKLQPGSVAAYLMREQNWCYHSAKTVGDMISTLKTTNVDLSYVREVAIIWYTRWKQQCDDSKMLW